MRTKFSRTVLAVGIALALAFTFSCSSGGGGGNDQNGEGFSSSSKPSSSSSNGNGNYSSEKIIIENFSVDIVGTKVRISGYIFATKVEPVVKVELITADPSWIKNFEYNTPASAIDLNAEIDLRNEEIECGKVYNIQLKACTDAACSPDKMATKNGTFTKPDNMCSAGGGSSSSSSSSEAVWVFGSPETVDDVPLNTSITIGIGSFKLISEDEFQPLIKTVSEGRIRGVDVSFGEEGVVPGKAYSSKANFLGSTVPSNSTELDSYSYYLIYLNDNSKYLVKFTRTGTMSSGFNYTYWRATESP